jgi:hypothetical protein
VPTTPLAGRAQLKEVVLPLPEDGWSRACHRRILGGMEHALMQPPPLLLGVVKFQSGITITVIVAVVAMDAVAAVGVGTAVAVNGSRNDPSVVFVIIVC